jgi:hypothetical protein
MDWVVEGYREVVEGNSVDVVENESIALLGDIATRGDSVRILAWLQVLQRGLGDPMSEPDILAAQRLLKYRCQGGAIVIFLADPARRGVDILRFATGASGLPRVGDLKLAEARLRAWRG